MSVNVVLDSPPDVEERLRRESDNLAADVWLQSRVRVSLTALASSANPTTAHGEMRALTTAPA